MSFLRYASRLLGLLLPLMASVTVFAADGPKPAATGKVSYYTQVRPIFQSQCQGCHQPAKPGGGYVMTSFDKLLGAGESKEPAIVPKKAAESHLIDQITPDKGKAEMPKGKPALTPAEIETITTWINQGAVDDTPANAKSVYDKDHLPVYSLPPVIGSIDFSPDGKWLAVGGFHEVLLWAADGSKLVGRLVGLSEKIESVRFSPDGTRLAVSGGQPGRMGEIQIWDVAKQKLSLSIPITFDTVYGASWSPDGSKIAIGCADNSVRAFDSKTGAQVLFMGGHNDWALDTTFSADGTHLVSVGRDMSVKLTEVATQRFVDNVTSITPGALKGGIGAVARHPKRDELVVGGSDGVPKVYRIFRQTVRVIGDDSNLIREFEPMKGRVNSVAVSSDGKRIAAGSSLDGAGEVVVYSYEFDTSLPDNLKAIMSKVASSRNPTEVATLNKYLKDGVKRISKIELPKSAVFSVAFSPDGKTLAAAGTDGSIHLYSPETGQPIKDFLAVPLSTVNTKTRRAFWYEDPKTEEPVETEALPKGAKITSVTVEPRSIVLTSPFDYSQLLVTAKLESGDLVDVTRMAEIVAQDSVVKVSRSGQVRAFYGGKTTVTVSIAGEKITIPVAVELASNPPKIDFIHDVNPVLSRLGCNQGTCHGSAQGKNGFKLSLRGYDPIFDIRAFTDDHASRRTNIASADDSLMLLKPTAAVPHVGGMLLNQGEPYYEILRRWISDGAKLNLSTPRVTKIDVTPFNPTIQTVGLKQQIRVIATYADGSTRDVTREAFVESGNIEVATASRSGLMTSLRRGEAPILVRFEGAYAATTLTVMGDRTGFTWKQPESYGKIDDLVAAKWQRMKIQPSEVCTDTEFLRRIYLDLTGLPPTADDVRTFLADQRPSRTKREALVDRLIGSKEYVEYWTNKWADLLQVNRKFLGPEGSVAFRKWIRDAIDKNVPYDQFVKDILTANGTNREHPQASYYKILREPTAMMENTTQLFLAVRFNCNKCHDHPFERWTQDQYYQTAAYFARVGLKPDPEAKGRTIGGTNVEAPKPFYEIVTEEPSGEVIHDRTKAVTPPKFPFPAKTASAKTVSRREELAAWITSKDNSYFARSYVNRLWGYLFSVGIIEPLDDIRAGNPASNPELLDYLTAEFLKSNFDARHIIRLITKSRTYQLSFKTNEWNDDDRTNFSHAIARRLPAEVLFDAVSRATGSLSRIPGVPPGTRAAELPDSEVELPSGFLTTFGRPSRESACECERSSGLQLGPVMALVSGPTISDAISDPNNDLVKLVKTQPDDKALINEIFLRFLNRPATANEIRSCLTGFNEIEIDHAKLAQTLGKLESEAAIRRPALELRRETELNRAMAELAAYQAQLAPKVAELEKQKAARTAELEKKLNAYAATLPAKVVAWEKQQSTTQRWIPLVPASAKAGTPANLSVLPDGTIEVTGPNRKGEYTITAETDLAGITGIRLEAIADPKLPSKGPGRAPDGNFVLTEFAVTAAPKADPKAAKPVKLQTPLASFSQDNFPIAAAIDGDARNQGTGWALSPTTGVTHWATFETAEPLGAAGSPTVLTIKLSQFFNGGASVYNLGRFRISVTKVAKPVGLGLPEQYRAILETAPELRTDAQRETLLAYHRALDAEYRNQANALNASRAPLPVDARLTELQAAVESAKKPVPLDPALVQLRKDVDMSVQQASQRRLTAVQDIAWALINSPAFLFNH